MRHVVPILMFVTIAGCATAGLPTTLTADQQKTVRAAVTAQLRDPDSARFGNMAGAQNKDGVIYVCGMVNARNGYGGYAGMAPFTGYFDSSRSTFVVNEIGTPDNYGAAMIHGCKARGVPL